MPKLCWCCKKPLHEYGERLDGVCAECGIEDTPLLDVTDAGRQVADCVRAMEATIVLAVGASEPESFPREVW